MKSKKPEETKAVDAEILDAIRHAEVDAFWSLKTSTVGCNLREAMNGEDDVAAWTDVRYSTNRAFALGRQAWKLGCSGHVG